jgi:aromatic-L-amino-acid decarboxylase
MPVVQPGFLRSKLAEEAPENGKEIEYLMEVTKKLIFPGVMNWQSPKFLGYYPSSVNVTSIFAEMFATTFQTPGFIYGIAPAFTELENVMVDWSAKALGLP